MLSKNNEERNNFSLYGEIKEVREIDTDPTINLCVNYDSTSTDCDVGSFLIKCSEGVKNPMLSESDRALLIEAAKNERNKFEKRVRAYLKRYGLKKVKSWSYWRDE